MLAVMDSSRWHVAEETGQLAHNTKESYRGSG